MTRRESVSARSQHELHQSCQRGGAEEADHNAGLLAARPADRHLLFMRTILRAALVAFFCTAAAKAQTIPAGAVQLSWGNLDIVITPDSSGAAMWVGLQTRPNEFDGFSASFVPRQVEAWATGAQEFLDRPLTDADTGVARVSRGLRGICGESAYVMRRREKGSWAKEPILVLTSVGDTTPMIIQGTQDDIKRIVSNLTVAAVRSPYDEEAAKRIILEEADDIVLDSQPSAKRSSRPPEYPAAARRANMDGLVVLNFLVEADGRADVATARPFYASDQLFLDAVRRALPNLRFDPGVKDGNRIRVRVMMPFVFSLDRR